MRGDLPFSPNSAFTRSHPEQEWPEGTRQGKQSLRAPSALSCTPPLRIFCAVIPPQAPGFGALNKLEFLCETCLFYVDSERNEGLVFTKQTVGLLVNKARY